MPAPAKILRIGSRGSDLALWQARFIASQLAVKSEISIIQTQGDAILDVALDKVEGKGFFTKEIEAALLNDEIDVAVHSFKDLPIEAPQGLTIAAVPKRGPVFDVLISDIRALDAAHPLGLKKKARVGTSSLRRKAQLLGLQDDLLVDDLRGNVPTRLRKLKEGRYDAIVLADAGLFRLGLYGELEAAKLVARKLAVHEICPAPAQGALAVQVREADSFATTCVQGMHDEQTLKAVSAERALLAKFGGGCHLSLGAFCEFKDGIFYLDTVVASEDGSVRLHAQAASADLANLVDQAYQKLLSQGVSKILATVEP